ncbi:MAG: hypothetical protein ACK4V1_05240 [Burkholderiaceae bacterium]
MKKVLVIDGTTEGHTRKIATCMVQPLQRRSLAHCVEGFAPQARIADGGG